MLNRVCLIGRLTKEPELRYTPSGVAVSNFTLAVDRNFKNAQGEKETDFIPCVVYRQTAEFVSNYLDKGKMAAVDGRIQVRTYTAQDGQKRWVTEVIGDNVHLLSPKSDTPSTQPNATAQSNTQGSMPPPPGYGQDPQGRPPGQGQPPGYTQGTIPTGSYGHEVNLDDDIPF